DDPADGRARDPTVRHRPGAPLDEDAREGSLMPSYRYTATTRAPIEVVWNVVQDHERMDLLLSPLAARAAKPWLAEEGSPDRNGVGALRRFGTLPLGERIVEFAPPRRLVYTIVNAPIRGYRGVIE